MVKFWPSTRSPARFGGKFKNPNHGVIRIDGLWALAFGDGIPSSDPTGLPDNALFFTAGPNFGNDGLFGTLTPVQADLTHGSDSVTNPVTDRTLAKHTVGPSFTLAPAARTRRR